jgi:amino acid transporter
VTTFAILVLAANTSLQGFPRLAALLARDRFFPRQFANLGDPLLGYLRSLTEDGDTIVNVIMPELVVRGWRRLLHNQRALTSSACCSSSRG